VKKIKYYIVDVFTDKCFGGNQLAVIPDATDLEESQLQKIAREFNFSETTFVFPPSNPKNDIRLRIFTPNKEIPTAGHPTIGTAFVLMNHEKIMTMKASQLVMEQKVGDIIVTFDEEKGIYKNITMQQPLPRFGEVFEDKQLIAGVLGIEEKDMDQELPVQAVSCGNNFLYVPISNQLAIKQILINQMLLEKNKVALPSTEIYVFTFDTTYVDSTTHGRMFAPLYGIYEDPVTGSASGPLGCYLVKYGKSEGENIVCEQGFEMGRPGMVYVNITQSHGIIDGVYVGGNAVLVSKGELYLASNEHKGLISNVLHKI
jgi:trans-2,3-dihydro-3-hydroxyanthranilate isomerase